MGIGKRLKESRERINLTQSELGKLVGVTGSAITNYEKETSHPKESIMYALMGALRIEPNYLFQDCVSIKKAPSMSDEAVEVAVAYDGAASGIQGSVRKLLDLENPRPKGEDYYPPFLNDAEIEEELESYRRDLIEEKRAKERLSAFKEAKDA